MCPLSLRPDRDWPGVVGEPEVAADDVLQQAGRLLLLQVDDHVAQRDGHVGEPVVRLADVCQAWEKKSNYRNSMI